MTQLRAVDRPGSAMAEEFENYEARLTEARRAVDRWEAEGGARESEHPAEQAPDAAPDGEPSISPGEPDEATHHHGGPTERRTSDGTVVHRARRGRTR